MTKDVANTSWGPFTAVGESGNFDSWEPDGPLPPSSWDDWTYSAGGGGVVTRVSATELKGDYPPNASGTYLVRAFTDIASLNASTLYVEFDAKMEGLKHGHKFLKLFGQRTAVGAEEGAGNTNYANCTFILDYASGSMPQVAFGDGTTITNDTQQILRFDGSAVTQIGRSYGVTANVSTPQNKAFEAADWGTDYHHFKCYVKFNSGTTAENEVADGEFYVEIDGLVYADATGLFNRHYSNSPLDIVEVFGYTQGGPPAGFSTTYRDPYVSTTGWRE